MREDIEIKRSGRKTMAVEINKELKVIVRVPYFVSDKAVAEFIAKQEPWIESHIELMRKKLDRRGESSKLPAFTDADLRELGAKALEMLLPRVEYYAKQLGVSYGRITVRNQVSRWGSCSSKGNLNFNCLLALCPDKVVDYVVIHELCHRREMNHSKAFWSLVECLCPSWKKERDWLKKEGSTLISRLK